MKRITEEDQESHSADLMVPIATERRLPFEPFAPNDDTIEAMEAARRGELVHIGGVDELMADLEADE